MFMNFEYPLSGSDVWDPATSPPTDDVIQEDLNTFFGVPIANRSIETQAADNRSWHYWGELGDRWSGSGVELGVGWSWGPLGRS